MVAYDLDDLERGEWYRSLYISIIIKCRTIHDSAMVALSVDRRNAAHALVFYTHGISGKLEKRIGDTFGRKGYLIGIGRGSLARPRDVSMTGGTISVRYSIETPRTNGAFFYACASRSRRHFSSSA